MFEDIKIPVKLGKDSIKEAILDLRFSDRVDEKLLADKISEFLKTQSTVSEVVTLPADIREKDSQLRITPGYVIRKNNFVVGVGLHNIVFDYLEPYDGWDNWFSKINEIINLVNSDEKFKHIKVYQYVLRYIDIFDKDITECCDIALTIGGIELNKKFAYRTELKDRGYDIHVIIDSAAKAAQTRVDIGVGEAIQNIEIMNFNTEIENHINEMHKVSKQYFFGILKDDFVKTLEPVY